MLDLDLKLTKHFHLSNYLYFLQKEVKSDLNSEKVKLEIVKADVETLTTSVNTTASKTEVVNMITLRIYIAF